MRVAIAVALIGSLVLAARVLAADTAISYDRTATNASAHNGQIVWSRVAEDGRARLVRHIGGVNVDLPVRPKEGQFDPDTGTSRRGHQVIVYTRCAGLSGQGCDIWEYDDGKRRERKLPGASRQQCSEFAPSIWIGTVAFARSGPGTCPGLFVARRGRVRRIESRVPAQTDIRGPRVAYLYILFGNPARTSIYVRSIHGGGSRRVVSGLAAQGESYRVTNPVLDRGYVYWLQEDRVRREFFAGRGLAQRRSALEFTTRTFPGRVTSMAVDGDRVYYAGGPGLLRVADPPVGFAPRG